MLDTYLFFMDLIRDYSVFSRHRRTQNGLVSIAIKTFAFDI